MPRWLQPARRYARAEGKAQAADLPPVEVVDMREELKAGNRSIFSRQLQENLKQVLDANQQAILFLNRRGSATYVFCRDCGHVLRSPRSDVPLTYHEGQETSYRSSHGLYAPTSRQMPQLWQQAYSAVWHRYGTGRSRGTGAVA